MIDHIHNYVIPAAYSVLPPRMESDHATAMLLAIGRQESGFQHRAQLNGGPARGFWMFEQNGIAGVLRHARARDHADRALEALVYHDLGDRIASCHRLVEDNDTIACVFARLLLWTIPLPLASEDQPALAWSQYVEAWRPGKPRRESWDVYYEEAWSRVLGRPPLTTH